MEQQAHRFAGPFLLPREAFRFEVTPPTLDYFCALKKRWGMSIATMIYRAFDLGCALRRSRPPATTHRDHPLPSMKAPLGNTW
ncbi:ImmA/IrrE family metallo-endopeptidase [Bradyrhizobium sp. CCGUVB4N]|uniref:ImmA/IrrE family metallo-endopeptidase n=1 Tax=Bradyrhizobium sp. CCGUVB4N TaxID=2949631 RepID=UPI0035C69954